MYTEDKDGAFKWEPVEMEINNEQFLQLYCAALTGLCSAVRREKVQGYDDLYNTILDQDDADEIAVKAYFVADAARQNFETGLHEL